MTEIKMNEGQMCKAFNSGARIADLMASQKMSYEEVTSVLREGGCNLAAGGRGRPGAKIRNTR